MDQAPTTFLPTLQYHYLATTRTTLKSSIPLPFATSVNGTTCKYTNKVPFLYDHVNFSWWLFHNSKGNTSFLDLTVLSPFLLLLPFKISTTLQPQDKIIAHTPTHHLQRQHTQGLLYSNSFNVLCAPIGSQPPTSLQALLLSLTALDILGSYASSHPVNSILSPTLNPSFLPLHDLCPWQGWLLLSSMS